MTRPDDLLSQALKGKAFLLFDGAMGTLLQQAGMPAGMLPELLNLENPQMVLDVHRRYVEAGAQVATANTFGANARKLEGRASVAEVYRAAVAIARQSGARYVAADVGPSGGMLEPVGPMTLDECEALYREQARAIAATDADLVICETFSDLLELKTAVLALKDACNKPILASMTFGEDGRTFLGVTPEAFAVTMSSLGVAALGVNCSQGPESLAPIVAALAGHSRVPLLCQANAGLPSVGQDGAAVFGLDAQGYAEQTKSLLASGVTILGGCCGTTPEHIGRLAALLRASAPQPPSFAPVFSVCSASRVVSLPARGRRVAVIGERLNPTGRKKLRAALKAGDLSPVADEAERQTAAGADLLDVNCGVPGIDEPAVLEAAVTEAQLASDLPLSLDSSDPAALARACRRYAGKPLVNSVNASAESLAAVLPVVARYGGAVVALTLDEDGVPQTARRRVELARKVVAACEEAGVPAEDVAVDCLAMAAATSPEGAAPVLDAIRAVRAELPVQACLGVSNVSFGLPARPLVNAAFLLEALGAGLTLPIMDPLAPRMAQAVDAHRALVGQDVRSERFVERYAGWSEGAAAPAGLSAGQVAAADGKTAGSAQSKSCGQTPGDPAAALFELVLKGRKGPAEEAARELLAVLEPGRVVDEVLIPALNEVGARFEKGVLFLPQLIASAEAANAAFNLVRAAMPAEAAGASKGAVVLATVKGDVHDIGKNIVRTVLESHGFEVHDLGRDVEPRAILDAVRATGARAVGLSALMTTTVPAMAETVALLRAEAPGTYVFVGGAVVTAEVARSMGADAYAKDAAESARLMEALFA